MRTGTLRLTALWPILALGTLLAEDPAYKPLSLYQGSWTATDHAGDSKATSTKRIVNECRMIGRFFACEQTVDVKPPSLVLFLPTGTPGHYYTQAISPELRAYGRGDLQIEGDHWIYSSKDEENGKTTYYRTTNLFSGPDRIHFEVSQSPDNQKWTITLSGDEVRTSKP